MYMDVLIFIVLTLASSITSAVDAFEKRRKFSNNKLRSKEGNDAYFGYE
jgi:hypothetical protein